MEAQYLTIKGDKLIFDYAEKFDSGEDDCLHGEFDLADYRRGIERINGNGSCELLGENCSMKILSRKGLVEIIFSEGNKSFFISELEKKDLA
jgi:hypothetical protein